MIRFSFTNLLAGGSVTVTASSAAASYPAANLATPEQPFNPARTTATGAQWWTVDFGSAQDLYAVALIRANFAIVRVQANSSDSWDGALLYDSGLTAIRRNGGNRRYHHLFQPGTRARYLHVAVPSQTPVDGATYYQLGGLWAGALQAPPRDIDWQHELERLEAYRDEEPDHGGWDQRAIVGEPRAVLRASRRAAVGALPGTDDDLETWLDLEMSYADSDVALVSIHDNPAHVWVMRRADAITTWKIAYPWATSDIELREVIR